MIYPQKISAKKSNFLIKILLVVSVIMAIILLIVNRITTPNLHWAALANAGIVYVWITVIYSVNKNKNIAGHVLVQTIAISLLTIYGDNKLGFKGWSINIAIPIMIIISNITMLVLTIVSYKKYIKYAIYQLVIVLFSMMPVIFIVENMLYSKTLGIIASGISIINLALSLILCFKDVKEVLVRKFHI